MGYRTERKGNQFGISMRESRNKSFHPLYPFCPLSARGKEGLSEYTTHGHFEIEAKAKVGAALARSGRGPPFSPRPFFTLGKTMLKFRVVVQVEDNGKVVYSTEPLFLFGVEEKLSFTDRKILAESAATELTGILQTGMRHQAAKKGIKVWPEEG